MRERMEVTGALGVCLAGACLGGLIAGVFGVALGGYLGWCIGATLGGLYEIQRLLPAPPPERGDG